MVEKVTKIVEIVGEWNVKLVESVRKVDLVQLKGIHPKKAAANITYNTQLILLFYKTLLKFYYTSN